MNDFVWVDLSTFDLPRARRFYAAVLGWAYADESPEYTTGVSQGWHSAGLYPMPAFFRKINMPSFWMSYIQVADIDQAVARAEELGAKVELQDDNAFGRFALIRDPLGAGFTCIENDAMTSARGAGPGQWCWNELVISDLARAEPFYAGLLGWSFEPGPDGRHMIHHASGRPIASVQVASNDLKGDKEYWAVYFAVADLARAKQAVTQAGGGVVYEYDTSGGRILIAHDDQGAVIYLTDSAITPNR